MTKRRSLPFMPLYVGDYLGDTRHLTTLQHGAYVLLIMHYWAHGELPRDDRALARIAGMRGCHWVRVRPVISAFFSETWQHKRVEAELKKAREFRLSWAKVTGTSRAEISQSFQSSKSLHPQRKKERKEDARAREKKYGGRKGKPNGLKATIKRAKQVLARDERRIAEAERRNQKGGANIVRLLSDGRGK
jgi:uncharacterized protein YdaU (DUF1376 family)